MLRGHQGQRLSPRVGWSRGAISLHLSLGPRVLARVLQPLPPGQLRIDRTRKWNVNPRLFKEREGLEARLGPRPSRVLQVGGLLFAHGLIYWRAASNSSFRQRTI